MAKKKDKEINSDKPNIVEKLKKDNKEKEKTLAVLQKQMSEMQKAFIAMQSNQGIKTTNSEKYSVGCRLIRGFTVYSPKREVDRRIEYGQFSEFSESEINSVLTNTKMKDFFKRDVIFFGKESDYEKFKINDRLDISNERIEHIVLNYNSTKLLDQFKTWTKDGRDHQVFHSLFYRIVELYLAGKITRMTHENLVAIEKFFKYSITNAIGLMENIKKII